MHGALATHVALCGRDIERFVTCKIVKRLLRNKAGTTTLTAIIPALVTIIGPVTKRKAKIA
jgi:hypothetical protein